MRYKEHKGACSSIGTSPRCLEVTLGLIAVYTSRRVPGVLDTEALRIMEPPIDTLQPWQIQLDLSIVPGSDPRFVQHTVVHAIQAVSCKLTAIEPDIAVTLTQSLWPGQPSKLLTT